MPVSSANSLSLSEQQLQGILVCLHGMQKDGQAEYVLLADISGQLIEHTGVSKNSSPPVLDALATGEVAATRRRHKLALHHNRNRIRNVTRQQAQYPGRINGIPPEQALNPDPR